VLGLLRAALGVPEVPSNHVITALAIVLSVYIMAPVGMTIYDVVRPEIEAVESGEFEGSLASYTGAARRAVAPLHTFLLAHSAEQDRTLLHEAGLPLRSPLQQALFHRDDLIVAVPAFVLSELREAFTIGFVLFLPFLIIDLVVANLLLTMGMSALNPASVSVPMKLLLFIAIDGWYLLLKGLILGYA